MRLHPMAVHRVALTSGVLAMLACAAQAAPPAAQATPPAAKSPPAISAVDSPDARGRAVLKAQLAALHDQAALVATFAPKATVLTPSGVNEVHEPDSGLDSIASLNPHAQIKSATFDHFTSGASGKLVWFAADLHIAMFSPESEDSTRITQYHTRAIELLDGAQGWKVVVAAFTRVEKLEDQGTSYIRDRDVTDVGPLTRLLLSPPAIASALGDGPVIYGTDPGERGLGIKDARALLARWKGLTITLDEHPKVHEVRGATYGYTMANVQIATKPGGTKYLLNAFLLALPGKDGAWSVVGAGYGAL